jgi:hypothetical protein
MSGWPASRAKILIDWIAEADLLNNLIKCGNNELENYS